jgi:hypothetical protein
LLVVCARSIALCDGGSRRHLFAYDVEARVRYRLRVEDAEMQDTEKNWAAFEYQGQLHFVCKLHTNSGCSWIFLMPSRFLRRLAVLQMRSIRWWSSGAS